MNIAQNWRLNAQRYALKGAQCEHCGTVTFPAREVCPNCQAKQPQLYHFAQAVALPESIELPERYEPRFELRQAAR